MESTLALPLSGGMRENRRTAFLPPAIENNFGHIAFAVIQFLPGGENGRQKGGMRYQEIRKKMHLYA